jgi:phospholipid/cholesterol/gamma-HCH transport system ATP-binding protein
VAGVPADAAVRFENVTKAFGDHRVLDDVSFEIPRASGFCLLGRSGTGKSVTLKHIIGLLRPDSGRVMVDNQDVASLDSRGLSRIRQGMGFLFQHAALFDSLTVGENVAFPLRRHRRDLSGTELHRIAGDKLAQVGLAADYDKMPADLSGGMRKWAGLARAMALSPSLLLVDEPSAGLDPITSAEIDQLLVDLKRQEGTTLVVVTHNIPSARAIGDELVLLAEGRIVARGTPEELDRSVHPLVRAFMRSEGTG